MVVRLMLVFLLPFSQDKSHVPYDNYAFTNHSNGSIFRHRQTRYTSPVPNLILLQLVVFQPDRHGISQESMNRSLVEQEWTT